MLSACTMRIGWMRLNPQLLRKRKVISQCRMCVYEDWMWMMWKRLWFFSVCQSHLSNQKKYFPIQLHSTHTHTKRISLLNSWEKNNVPNNAYRWMRIFIYIRQSVLQFGAMQRQSPDSVYHPYQLCSTIQNLLSYKFFPLSFYFNSHTQNTLLDIQIWKKKRIVCTRYIFGMVRWY